MSLKLLSVADLVRETGLPRQQVDILLQRHQDEIPSVLEGTRRRYTSETVPALLHLWNLVYRKSIERDPDQGAWFDQALKTLEEVSDQLSRASRALGSLRSGLKKRPQHLVFYINVLPHPDLELVRPVAVQVDREADKKYRALFLDAGLEAYGTSDEGAALNIGDLMVRTFLRLDVQRLPFEEEQFRVLASFIQKKV